MNLLTEARAQILAISSIIFYLFQVICISPGTKHNTIAVYSAQTGRKWRHFSKTIITRSRLNGARGQQNCYTNPKSLTSLNKAQTEQITNLIPFILVRSYHSRWAYSPRHSDNSTIRRKSSYTSLHIEQKSVPSLPIIGQDSDEPGKFELLRYDDSYKRTASKAPSPCYAIQQLYTECLTPKLLNRGIRDKSIWKTDVPAFGAFKTIEVLSSTILIDNYWTLNTMVSNGDTWVPSTKPNNIITATWTQRTHNLLQITSQTRHKNMLSKALCIIVSKLRRRYIILRYGYMRPDHAAEPLKRRTDYLITHS